MAAIGKETSVVHIGPGRYKPFDRDHVTYGIWRELANGFRDYHVIGRSHGRAAQWSDGNLHVTLLPSRVAREAEFLFTQFKSVAIAREAKPHVIVCQSPIAGGLAAAVVAKQTGARLLVELHSDIYFPTKSGGIKSWLTQRLSERVLERAATIRVLSQGMLQRLRMRYGSAIERKAQIVPPRVDLSRFASKFRTDRKQGPLRVIMVGSVNARKGQLRLIDALAAARVPVELHLVGDGPDLPDCRRKANEHNGKLSIICHGAVPISEVSSLLDKADVFVLYSNSEGTPRAIMEAMASGIPVVTTNAGFCVDLIEHGTEGFILGPDPDAEIGGILQRFNDDPDLARRMGAAGRKRAERDYDSVRLFQAYRRLIEETATA